MSVPLNFKDNSSSQVKIDVYLNVEEKEPSSSATADVKEKPNVVATEKIPFAVRPSFERSVSGTVYLFLFINTLGRNFVIGKKLGISFVFLRTTFTFYNLHLISTASRNLFRSFKQLSIKFAAGFYNFFVLAVRPTIVCNL